MVDTHKMTQFSVSVILLEWIQFSPLDVPFSTYYSEKCHMAVNRCEDFSIWK